MFQFSLLSVLTLFLATLGGHAFRNPIIPGFNPDPTILSVGDDYFISTSTFEFFPGHPIYHSKDLVNWKLIGHALNRPSQIPLYGFAPEGGIWAPTLRHYNGTFYLFTTNRNAYSGELREQSRGFFVTTKDIFSNYWSEPVYLDAMGYDSDIYIENGTAWVSRPDFNDPIDQVYGIYQTKVDLKTGRSLTTDNLIFNGTLPLNSSSRPEGPHIYKKDGTYYLLIAEGGTHLTHRSTIQRGPSPSGPWESYAGNPLVYNGANPDPVTQPVQFTGHSDFAQTPSGDWWGVCLGVRPQGGNINRTQLGRETFLFPVTWSDGWPTFNHNKSIGLVGPGLFNLSDPLKATSWYDDFSGHKLDEGYYYLRTPYSPFHALVRSGKKSLLRIWGSAVALGNRDTPSVLLRKQTALNQVFETTVDFEPETAREEAGATIFYSDFYHDEIFVSGCPNATTPARCVVHRSIYPNNATGTHVVANFTVITEDAFPIAAKGPVKLTIQGEALRYNFGYAVGSDNTTWVGSIDSVWLVTPPPNYSIYKGTHFGLYATGGNKPMGGKVADFHYWNQRTYAPDY
ncbi:glycoside hydrolase family 43 protein [Plicaturopsis crispa FD-325 SS-3]|nr:glycoside hydrolase family 43 protein [Plicaturopsis crispa FD-325 SS-3]